MDLVLAALATFATIALVRAAFLYARDWELPNLAVLFFVLVDGIGFEYVLNGWGEETIARGLAAAGLAMGFHRVHRWLGAAGDAYITSVIRSSKR